MADVEEIGKAIIRVLEQLLPYERGAIAIVDRDGGELRLLAHSAKGLAPGEFKAEFQRVDTLIRQSRNDGVIRRTVETGTAIRIDDVRAFEGYLAGDDAVRSELCVPVTFARRTIGAINVESFEPNGFDDDDAGLLSVLANQVALALENAWLSKLADEQTQSRNQAERDARAAGRLLSEAIESLVDGIALFDENRTLRFCNSNFRALYPAIANELRPGVTADRLTQVARDRGQIVEPPGTGQPAQDLFLDHTGMEPGSRVLRTAHGQLVEVRESQIRSGGQICLHIDITERTRVERALAQAQRVEAIGRLTAGVAHDFNNLLAVIMGNLELAEESIADLEVAAYLDEGLKATRRCAHLTQQLLAFGRRSTLIPKLVDPNAIISGVNQMFRRTLPVYIYVETVLAAGLWKIQIDPVQLETAILNLVNNARDAMPGGGTLTIETANVRLEDEHSAGIAGVLTPGRYAMIAVSDTGTGMTPEVEARVFEPFFSTKPSDKGAGLGLSMVFGFVRQSGGDVRIHTEPGRGTSVKLYFPQADAEAARQTAVVSRSGAAQEAKGCILVVEDSEHVRSVIAGRLNRMGFDTVEAPDGDSALALLRSGVKVDLVLADVVMPGALQGPELVEIAKAEMPGLKAILMSGYAKRASEYRMASERKIKVMTKPMSRRELETVIRSVMQDGD